MEQRIIDDFFQFLRFSSVSADPAQAGQMTACADWLIKRLEKMGLPTRLIPTGGHPAVFAATPKNPGLRTVLIYGHYDVQPPDPLNLWDSPPFEPTLKDGIVTARGAADNKGQIFSHLCGVEASLKRGETLPVNLIFFIEGEEEIGSANLADTLRAHRELLACDVVVISDTTMLAPGVPALTYGMRGLAALELKMTGPARDLHSGLFGGIVANPLREMARLLASLHDSTGKIAVPAFYDDVAPIEEWEKKAWAQLPICGETYLTLSGSPELAGEEGFTLLERLWARPTAEINGLYGGYQGPGSKTVLPAEAHAKLTFRLPPRQDPIRIQSVVEAHLRKQCPTSVHLEITRGHCGEPVLFDGQSKWSKAALKSLSEAFGGVPAHLVRDGATIPIVADFQKILGVDCLLAGLALPDCRAHSPNETFHLANLEAGIRLNQILLRELASA